MSSNCIANPITIDKFEESIQDIIFESDDDVLEQNILNEIINAKDNLISPDDTPIFEIIATSVENVANALGIDVLHPDFFKKQTIIDKLTYIDQGGTYNNDTNASNQLADSKDAESKSEANLEFLVKSYGGAFDVRDHAVIDVNMHLVDALFLGRGLLSHTGTVTSICDLNRNVREYQQKLFDTIKEYLLNDADITQEERNFLESNPQIYTLTSNGTYQNSGNWLHLMKIANRSLEPRKRLNVDGLQNLYKLYTEENDKFAERKLKAYNALVFLKNFDNYISSIFDGVINIESQGRQTGSDTKYTIAESISETSTTFRDSEPNVEEEVDKITKMILSLIPIRINQSNETISNRYLKFQEFEHILGKIKALSINKQAANIVFDDRFETGYLTGKVWNSLSEKTKNFIQGKRFSQIISEIRINDQKALPALFELLSNKYFQDAYKNTILSADNFDLNQLAIIWSIYQDVYNEGNEKSIMAVSDSKQDVNYFKYINQISNTVFKSDFIQIFEDPSSARNRKIRLLTDTSVINITREIEDTINYALSDNFGNSEIDVDSDPLKRQKIIDGMRFKIPNTDLTVSVYYQTQDPVIKAGDKTVKANNLSDYITDKQLLEFTDQFTQLNLSKNKPLLETIQYLATSELNFQLLEMASRIIANHYANKTIISESRDPVKAVEETFGENSSFKYDRVVKQTQLVSPKDHSNFIPKILAKAQASLQGSTTAVQVNDSERASQSLCTFSRLVGSISSMWDLIERKDPEYVLDEVGNPLLVNGKPVYNTDSEGRIINRGSASRGFSLLNNPDLFEGYYGAHEFYNPGTKSKKVSKFTTAELIYSGVFQQFAPALYKEDASYDSFKFVNDGMALFLASVNSDKKLFGFIRSDIKTLMPVYDSNGQVITKKPYKDFTAIEHQNLISKEFGDFYANMYQKIEDDFNAINNYIEAKYKQVLKDKFTGHENLINVIDQFKSFNYADNFKEFKKWYQVASQYADFKKEFPTESDVLFDAVLEHNYSHQNNPIEITDQIHTKKRKTLERNNSLIAQLYTFNPNFIISKGIDLTVQDSKGRDYKYYSQKEFWRAQASEVTRSLINSNFSLNLLHPSRDNILLLNYIQNDPKFKKENGINPWLTKGNSLVYSIFHQTDANGNVIASIPISGIADIKKIQIRTGKYINDVINDPSFGYFELNPIYEQYNYMDYFITQEWQNSGVGSFVALPDKSGSVDALEQASSQCLAQNKRNVMWTAQMEQETLNDINGMPEYAKMATIEDYEGYGTVISGKNRPINEYGGATFVSGVTSYLENKSLGGAAVGSTKKDFCAFKNGKLGTGGIIKTANYAATNDKVRNYPLWGTIMKKTLDLPWVDENNKPYEDIDITKSYLNEKIDYSTHENPKRSRIYFQTKEGKFYELLSIEHVGNNLYKRLVQEVSQNDYNQPIGEPILFNLDNEVTDQPVYINNNYDLWRYFGGAWSMQANADCKTLSPSENSIKLVVKAVNKVGFGKVDIESLKNDKQISQHEVYQPLKHAIIHWVMSQDSIKIGPANINKVDVYTNEKRLNYQNVRILQMGPQLDKEHHADNAQVSLFTQVMSASTQTSYTTHLAENLYQGLRRITEVGLKDLMTSLEGVVNKKYNKTDLKEFTTKVIQVIIDALAKPDSTSFAEQLAFNIQEKVRQGLIDYSDGVYALSDNTLYHKALSNFSSKLSKIGIKLKVQGLLAVLNPSKGFVKLYGDRKYGSFKNPTVELEMLQRDYDNHPIYVKGQSHYDLAKLEFGRTYKIVLEDSEDVLTNDFWDINVSNYLGFNIIQSQYESLIGKDNKPVAVRIDGNNVRIDIQLLSEKFNAGVYDKIGFNFKNFREFVSYILAEQQLKNTETRHIGELEEDFKQRLKNRAYKRITGEEVNTDIIYEDLQLREDLQEIHKKFPAESDSEYAKRIQYEFEKEKARHKTNPGRVMFLELGPDNYYDLRELAKHGKVKSVVEYIKNGRDLAAYNVRFRGVSGQELTYHQLWDLDSIRRKHEIVELIESGITGVTPETQAYLASIGFYNTNATLDEAHKYYSNQVQRDLEKLSNEIPDKMQILRNIESSNDTAKAKRVLNFIRNHLNPADEYAAMQLLEDINSCIEFIKNCESLKNIVYIDGKPIEVDKSSIQVQAFELAMPKMWKEEFGFDEYQDLNEVKNDPDWFVKRMIKNKNHRETNRLNYDVVLENINGKHIYILNSKNLNPTLQEIPAQIVYDQNDGKYYRQDFNGKNMYQVPKNTKIYTDTTQTVEIFVFDDATFIEDVSECLTSLPHASVNFSENLFSENPDYIINLLEGIKENSKFVENLLKYSQRQTDYRLTQQYRDEEIPDDIYNREWKSDIFKFFQEWTAVTEDNYKELLKDDHPLIKLGRRKYTTFLKSLDVVAARVPAQGMMSFMAMKCVAYDNPNLNNAFVSDLQFFLQGSKVKIQKENY